MSLNRLPLSRSVIVDVLRAIVSRPISQSRSRPLILTCTNLKCRFYSSSTLDDNTKKEKYHLLTTTDANGKTRENVKGFKLKSKREPKTLLEYNKKILYALNEDRINKAIKILREMEHNKIKPDVYSYTMIINAFSKQSDMQRARKWLGRMLENKVSPDANAYTSMIDGYMRESNVDAAEAMFKLMMKRDIKPTIVTYNVLMHHSVKKLDMESALKFWTNLLEAGLRSDVYTFAIILHGLGNEGRVDEAWGVYHQMRDEGINVNEVVANTLMGMHVKQHDYEYALKLFSNFFHEHSSLKPTAHTRTVLLNAVVSNADLETIHKHYDHYLRSLKEPTDSPLFSGASVYAYTTFMRAFLRVNDFGMVNRVYQDMISRQIQPTIVTFATLMLAHAFIPDPEACQRIFYELKNNGVRLNAVIYTILMKAWATAGRYDKVKDTYALMKNDKIQPTKSTMEVLRRASSTDSH